jgi:hypothetical protein
MAETKESKQGNFVTVVYENPTDLCPTPGGRLHFEHNGCRINFHCYNGNWEGVRNTNWPLLKNKIINNKKLNEVLKMGEECDNNCYMGFIDNCLILEASSDICALAFDMRINIEENKELVCEIIDAINDLKSRS